MDKNKVSIQPWFYQEATSDTAFTCILSLELHKCQGTLRTSEAAVLLLRGD